MSDKETMSNWGNDEKIAAIFYYYLSLTQDSAEEKAVRFEDLFDVRKSVESYLNTLGLLDQDETVPDDGISPSVLWRYRHIHYLRRTVQSV